MKPIKLAIVGSRTFNDYNKCKDVVEDLVRANEYDISDIVSGGAKGADTLAEQYASENNINTIIFKADWKKYGKRAGFIRNVDIIKNCDVCIAFWDGESHGTKHDLELCKEYKKDCWIYYYLEGKIELLDVNES